MYEYVEDWAGVEIQESYIYAYGYGANILCVVLDFRSKRVLATFMREIPHIAA